ncbi:carboxyvinyl-carboxyphosphonate phosphorylmutase [Streptomyces sp. WAC 01529]|uniref:isocitrate lyase/PEP mutase family protein n=1 Tax=Streptomyces sp. WAC 01529 TaxID=2203205 RepID=UPI000F6E77C4|nr:isocitrate lyase/phosphoenolpyruvate mutase family protein [Streptomyces sp. WAC 01529]AZM57838.1 carboxyvinyl-carboxyphosphonate phosphorylmutase [Streptomyces sp. WAC 01529]
MSPVAALRALHHDRAPGDPLVLPGPWDAASARVFEEAGSPALATPSAGIALSLGYEDGQVPPGEMFAAIARIVRSVSVPVSADIEGGYGLPAKELVERLLETGAVGCNLEDSVRGEGGGEGGGEGVLREPAEQADFLAEVRAAAGDRLFVNARVDTFLRGVPEVAAAVERARLYVAAGADCVYPILAPPEALPALRAGIEGPLNAVAGAGGPSPQELGKLGATRITFGPGLLHRSLGALRDIAGELV